MTWSRVACLAGGNKFLFVQAIYCTTTDMQSNIDPRYMAEDQSPTLYSITFTFLTAAVCTVTLRCRNIRPALELRLTLSQAVLSVVSSSYPTHNAIRDPHCCCPFGRHRIMHLDPFSDPYWHGEAYRVLAGSSGDAENKHESGTGAKHLLPNAHRVR
jgi:hypothetical protein